ncbi:MAG: FAD-binding oxidoreductase [Acidimicrobiales bacterium]
MAGAAAPPAIDAAVLDELRAIVGAGHVLTDPELTAGYVRDWTGRYVGATPAVVRPADTAQVAAVLRCCQRHRIAVTAQGGNTGLVGGGVPLGGELLLSLRRLDRIDAVDVAAAQVTVGAGATLAAVQAAARAAGLAFGVDLGARDSATIGGMAATNAGGLHLLRYGGMREQVLGYEAVLADGRVLRHLDGLLKDNTGYDLGRLLCGSEGTLAVITALRLRLVAHLEAKVAALLAFADVDTALDAAATLRRDVSSVEAIELFFADGLELVTGALGVSSPFAERHGCYVLVECAARRDPTDELAEAVAGLHGLADAAVAAEPGPRAALWRLREGHPEAINTLGAPHKLDVTLPASQLGHFTRTVGAVIAEVAPRAQTWLFGHAADGNIHVNITGIEPDDERADDAVLRYVASLGGSISAEHGIGTAKRAQLHLNRSETELAVFRALKAALDPVGVLNPAVLLPPEAGPA